MYLYFDLTLTTRVRVPLLPPYPEFVSFQEPMSSTSAKTADVEAGRSPFQHPRRPGFSGRVSTSRVSTATYPMMSTSRVTVIYPMLHSQPPLAACRTLMNILCGTAAALTVLLALYIYCTAVVEPSCPVHGQYLCSLNTKSTLSHTAGWHCGEVLSSRVRGRRFQSPIRSYKFCLVQGT